MKKLVFLLLLPLLLVGCESLTYKEVKIGELFTIELESSMADMRDINPEACLQYGNLSNNLFLMVITEPIEEYAPYYWDDEKGEINREELHEQYYDMIMEQNKDIYHYSTLTDEELSIEGLLTKKVSFDSHLNGNSLHFKIAVIVGNRNLYQILSWTTAENIGTQYEDAIDYMIASFKEL